MKKSEILEGIRNLVIAIIGLSIVATVVFLFVAAWSQPAESQNLCGNSCLSSADCMEGCVCMDDEGDGMGVCVSFN